MDLVVLGSVPSVGWGEPANPNNCWPDRWLRWGSFLTPTYELNCGEIDQEKASALLTELYSYLNGNAIVFANISPDNLLLGVTEEGHSASISSTDWGRDVTVSNSGYRAGSYGLRAES